MLFANRRRNNKTGAIIRNVKFGFDFKILGDLQNLTSSMIARKARRDDNIFISNKRSNIFLGSVPQKQDVTPLFIRTMYERYVITCMTTIEAYIRCFLSFKEMRKEVNPIICNRIITLSAFLWMS
jgi:hypothetical protein